MVCQTSHISTLLLSGTYSWRVLHFDFIPGNIKTDPETNNSWFSVCLYALYYEDFFFLSKGNLLIRVILGLQKYFSPLIWRIIEHCPFHVLFLQLLFYLKRKVVDIYQLPGAKPSRKNIILCCSFPCSNHCSCR